MSLRSGLTVLVCAVPIVIAACDDDTTGPPAERAILFQHVTWPDTIVAASPWTLRAFALLGSDLCWGLKEARIDRDSTSLVAHGTSRYDPPPAGVCPLALAQEWITITGPALPAGDYTLAAGDFRDTLIVREQADASGSRLMAGGWLWVSNAAWYFSSEAFEQYQVSNPESVPSAGRVRLYGNVIGPAADFVRVRRLEYVPPVPVPEPTQVPADDMPPDSDRIYYATWCGGADEVGQAQELLTQLLADGLHVTRAWFPVGCSPCECALCTEGVGLELAAPDGKVARHGFVPDTGSWVFNCGIAAMWRFVFPQ